MKVNFHLELKPIKAEAVNFEGGTLDVSTEMNLDEMKQYTDTLFQMMEVLPAYINKLNDLGPVLKVETPETKFQVGGNNPEDEGLTDEQINDKKAVFPIHDDDFPSRKKYF